MNEFIRKLDGLGRIVLPKEYRKKLKINDDSKIRITIENDYIKIEKYSDINDNLERLKQIRKILIKELNLDIIITDLDDSLNEEISLSTEIINKIKYGKIEMINNQKDILFNTNKNINIIIIPIILYGEIIGSLIGYSYEREINEIDKKILGLVQSILIKDIEE